MFNSANIVITAVSGAIAGTLWYFIMRRIMIRRGSEPIVINALTASHVTGRLSRPRNAQPPIRTGSGGIEPQALQLAKIEGSATSATIAREANAPAQ